MRYLKLTFLDEISNRHLLYTTGDESTFPIPPVLQNKNKFKSLPINRDESFTN